MPVLAPLARPLAALVGGAFLAETILPPPAIQAGAWPALADFAESQGLAPLLYAALKARGQIDHIPPEVKERLKFSLIRSDVTNALAFEELDRLLGLCARENIPVVLLKGAAFAGALYAEKSWRPLGDLDLLIHHADAARIRPLMLAAGYAPSAEMAEGFQRSFSFEETFLREGARGAQVDIHWHLFESGYFRARVPIAWFWERTSEIQREARQARGLSPEANLIYLSAHFILHHHADRLLWSYDLALLLSRHAREMNWEQVLDAAEEFGLAQPLLQALRLVGELWEAPVPARVLERLSAARTRWQDRLALAAIHAPHSDLRFLVDGLSAPGLSKLGLLLRTLFPARDYMRERYQIRDERLLPVYYALRPLQMTGKLVRSVFSFAAGR